METVTHRVVYTCDVCRAEATALDYVLSNSEHGQFLRPTLPDGWVERRSPSREHFCSRSCEVEAVVNATMTTLRGPNKVAVAEMEALAERETPAP